MKFFNGGMIGTDKDKKQEKGVKVVKSRIKKQKAAIRSEKWRKVAKSSKEGQKGNKGRKGAFLLKLRQG